MLDTDQLKTEIDSYVDRVWPSVIDDIKTLVAIPSVADEAKAVDGAPWGIEAKKALDAALAMGEKLGLSAHDCEGYMGFCDLEGQCDTQIATIAHVDVVPAGPGWHTDPFVMEQREGYLLGRGVIDDKGPAVLSLYAAAFFAEKVKQTGKKLPYTLRIMLGSDEEVGMGDVDWYLEHYDEPAFLFTPDAEFPVCCGEKGGYNATFISEKITDGRIVDFYAGEAKNAIPGIAYAVVKAEANDVVVPQSAEIEDLGDGTIKITMHGKSGHASLPQGTINACGLLVDCLVENGIYTEQEKKFLDLQQLIFADTQGQALGVAATDDIFEPLTCVGSVARLENGCLCQTIDIRYPKSTTAEALTQKLSACAQAHDARFETGYQAVPFYVDPQAPEIQTLVGCYNEYTGKQAEPFTIGGGTYARHFARAASFGPEEEIENQPEWAGQMHGPDESVNIEILKRSLKIYIYAIAKLQELDLPLA